MVDGIPSWGTPVHPAVQTAIAAALEAEDPPSLSPWQEDPLRSPEARHARARLFGQSMANMDAGDFACQYITLRDITRRLVHLEAQAAIR